IRLVLVRSHPPIGSSPHGIDWQPAEEANAIFTGAHDIGRYEAFDEQFQFLRISALSFPFNRNSCAIALIVVKLVPVDCLPYLPSRNSEFGFPLTSHGVADHRNRGGSQYRQDGDDDDYLEESEAEFTTSDLRLPDCS